VITIQKYNVEAFTKFDTKVGVITDAKKHPETEHYILNVDIGKKQVQVVSHLTNYSTEQLLGKRVSVVLNIWEREVNGTQSQGILLTAQHEGKPILVCPECEVPPGANVKFS